MPQPQAAILTAIVASAAVSGCCSAVPLDGVLLTSSANPAISRRSLLETSQPPPPPLPPPPPPPAGGDGSSSPQQSAAPPTENTVPAPQPGRTPPAAQPPTQRPPSDTKYAPPQPAAAPMMPPPQLVQQPLQQQPPPGGAPENGTSVPQTPQQQPPQQQQATTPGLDFVDSDILAAHNLYRSRHVDTPPLAWSADLAAQSQAWAQRCVFQHSHEPGVGENLYQYEATPLNAAPAPDAGWGLCLEAWCHSTLLYNEISSYDGYFSEAAGHYSQKMVGGHNQRYIPSHLLADADNSNIVWADTRQVGCALQPDCPDDRGGNWARQLYVCKYEPQGNILDGTAFADNVKPLTAATADSCSGN